MQSIELLADPVYFDLVLLQLREQFDLFGTDPMKFGSQLSIVGEGVLEISFKVIHFFYQL